MCSAFRFRLDNTKLRCCFVRSSASAANSSNQLTQIAAARDNRASLRKHEERMGRNALEERQPCVLTQKN